jgi:hypothetical protein
MNLLVGLNAPHTMDNNGEENAISEKVWDIRTS